MAWIDNYIHSFVWDVVTHPYYNSNDGLAKHVLKLGYELVITSHSLQV